MAGAAFGEDPLCVNVILDGRRSIWDTFLFAIAACIGTAARGAMLPSSFVPFCLAKYLVTL